MVRRNGNLAVKEQPTKPIAPKGAGREGLTAHTQEPNEEHIKPTEIEFISALNTGKSFDPENPSTSLFKFTIAFTKGVWNQCLKRVYAEDFERALWNILWPLKVAVERSSGGSIVCFQAKNYRGKLIMLKARARSGTFATPVPLIKIMTSEKDGTAS